MYEPDDEEVIAMNEAAEARRPDGEVIAPQPSSVAGSGVILDR